MTCKQESDVECLIDNLFTYESTTSNASASSPTSATPTPIESKVEQQQVKCTNCDENNHADWFCTNCNEWLCEECKIAHTRVKLTKDHSILFKTAVKQQQQQQQAKTSVEKQNKTNTNVYCSIHSKEKLFLYCETCDLLTCRDCQLSSRHKEHKYKFINEAAAQQRLQFQLYLDKLKKRKKFLQTADFNIDSRKADINVKSISTINDIKTISSNLIIEFSEDLIKCLEYIKVNFCDYLGNVKMYGETLNRDLPHSKHGDELFLCFYKLGCQASSESILSFEFLKNSSDHLALLVKSAGQLIVDITFWILLILSWYDDSFIDLDEYDLLNKEVYEIRSGLKFMIDLFTGCNNGLDYALRTIEDETFEDIDNKIALAKEFSTFKIKEEDVPKSIPKTHTWWFETKK